jgi:D-sorbitol dehydrogenase-like protein
MKRPFHMWPLTRRATLRISISAAICGLFPSWKASAQARISEELQARFLGWSRTATGFADLPPDTARACLELVLRSGIGPEALAKLAPYAYGGTPIEKQLLEAWYTGIFKLDGSRDVRSYTTTLMWRAAGIDPPPGTCDGGPERWASAPSNL